MRLVLEIRQRNSLLTSTIALVSLLAPEAIAQAPHTTQPTASAGAKRAPDAPAQGSSERQKGDVSIAFPFTVEGPDGNLGSGADGKASDILGPRLVFGLDIGARVSPKVRLSARVSGIMGSLGSSFESMCDAGKEAASDHDSDSPTHPTCGSYGYAVSVHLRYDFHTDSSRVTPYVAYGVGYESVSVRGSTGASTRMNASFDGALAGLNLATPELGIDIPLGNHGSLWLFASAKLGKYTDRSGSLTIHSTEIDADYGTAEFQRWFGGGIGASYF